MVQEHVQEMMNICHTYIITCMYYEILETQQQSVPASQWVIDLLQPREQPLPFYPGEIHVPLMTSLEHCV